MIQFLSLLKNPLTKMVFNKATDHFKHKAEKTKIIMLWLIGMLTTGWFPSTRENFREWVALINDLPDSVWYLVIIVFTASFGSRVTKSVLDRKKK